MTDKDNPPPTKADLRPETVRSEISPSISDLDAVTQVSAVGVQPGDCQPCVPIIPGYEILREIGRGGMGLVCLARDVNLDRHVALKTFHAGNDANLVELLQEEARVSGKLEHPAIVPVYHVNPTSKPAYFSMAFVDGEDLARRVSRQVLEPRDAAELGAKIAEAMHHAHQQGVLHLDIKPANILLDRKGEPRVTDFGLFALLSSKKLEGVGGTPQFMAPEQAVGETEKLSPASDVYSLGAVLFAAMSGRPPLVASNEQDLILKVVSARPRPLSSYGLRIPLALDAIVMKCLEKNPEDRYTTALELKEDLHRFLNDEPTVARPPGIMDRSYFFLKQHVFAASVSGSVVLVLLAAVAAMFAGLSRHNAILQAEVTSFEEMMGKQQSQFRSALLRHTEDERTHLKITEDFAVEMARDWYARNDLDKAAFCAAEALLAAYELGTPPSAEIEKILLEHATSNSNSKSETKAETEQVDLLKIARDLTASAMANAKSSPPNGSATAAASADK